MFSRAVSILLMLVMVACPLWCSSGLAHYCAGDSAQQTSQLEQAVPCCCPTEADSGSDEVPSDTPSEPAEACQGVCGGAVLEKSHDLDESEDGCFLPAPALTAPIALKLIATRPGVASIFHSKANIGRSLRTLHMSFLC